LDTTQMCTNFFYRMHISTTELANVSKLLITVDGGKAHEFVGKSMEDTITDDDLAVNASKTYDDSILPKASDDSNLDSREDVEPSDDTNCDSGDHRDRVYKNTKQKGKRGGGNKHVLSVENDSDDETTIMTTIMMSSTSQPMTPSLTDMTMTWLLETMTIMLLLLNRRMK